MNILRRLARAAILSLALLALPALAKPALWVAHAGNSTMYLFGTVHLLPDHTDWHSMALDKALARSDALYIEITDDSPVHMQLLVMKYGLDLQHPLSSKLDAADMKRLRQAVQTADLPAGEATLEPMQPWLAGLTLSVAPLLKAGMDPNSGVDKQLKARFEKAGKPVRGLETAEEQIRFFADMTPKLQLDFLRNVLKDYGNTTKELSKLVVLWDNGDVAGIGKLGDLKMRQDSPVLYKRLIEQRNHRWSIKLARIMKTPGTYFVAVGAAHLAGPDCVQEQLKAHGIDVRRMQ